MGCWPSSPSLVLERIFNRIRCVLACCGGQVIVQNSEFCDGKNTDQHLSRPKSTRKFRWFRCCLQSSQRERKEQDIARLVESAGCLYSSQTRRRRYKRSRVIVPGINAQFQADLVDLQNLSRYNKGYKCILTRIDIIASNLKCCL